MYSVKDIIRFFVPFLLFPAAAYAAQDSASGPFTLESTVRMVIDRNPLEKASELAVRKAELNVKGVKLLARGPQINLTAYTGVVPEARGDVFFSPDGSNDFDGFGPFYRMTLELMQPLLTFGRSSSAVSATESVVGAERSRNEMVQQSLAYEAIRVHWGLASARRAVKLSRETQEQYDEFLSQVLERARDEESEVDFADVFEVRSFEYTVDEMFQESLKLEKLAERTFNALVHRDLDTPVVIADEKSPSTVLGEDMLREMVRVAERQRPELRALSALVDSFQYRLNFSRSDRLPVVFLAGGLDYAVAPGRADQTNPFVYDNFNFWRLGLALGVNWDLNLIKHNVEINKARTDHEAIQRKREAVLTRVGVDVRDAFAEAQKDSALLESVEKSLRSARSWLRLSFENWQIGIGEPWRMLRAYQVYYRLLGLEIERDYKNNLAIARLALATGNMNLYLRWIETGHVEFE